MSSTVAPSSRRAPTPPSATRASGRTVASITALEHALFDRVAYPGSGWRSAASCAPRSAGALPWAIASPCSSTVNLRIFEGYGLTETAPTLTVNRPGAWKPGTVGQPVAGTSIRIAGDSEILPAARRSSRDEAATKFDDDGWFHPGDRGELDDGGFLRTTGRKTDLIVTASGKNIAGTPLEDRLRAHSMISQAIVLGDRRPFIAALIALDEEGATRWADSHGRAGTLLENLATDPRLRREIQRAVDTVNRSLSRAESIRKFVVLPHDLRVETGEPRPHLQGAPRRRGADLRRRDSVALRRLRRS
jgi:long-chain acyl-CoA synthetase